LALRAAFLRLQGLSFAAQIDFLTPGFMGLAGSIPATASILLLED
jgi:hypothetical protein